jgi:hypothetical protein
MFVMRREAVGEPGDAIGGMIEHAGRKPGLLDLAVAEQQRADPAHVRIHRAERPAAEHQRGIRRVVRDRVQDFSGLAGLGIDAVHARLQNLERGRDVVGGVEHVEDGAIGTA